MTHEESAGEIGPGDSSSLLIELKAQCERLLRVVQSLEDERRRDAEALAALRARLNQYERVLYDWAHQQVREEDWKDFDESDYTISFEGVADLERQPRTMSTPNGMSFRLVCSKAVLDKVKVLHKQAKDNGQDSTFLSAPPPP